MNKLNVAGIRGMRDADPKASDVDDDDKFNGPL